MKRLLPGGGSLFAFVWIKVQRLSCGQRCSGWRQDSLLFQVRGRWGVGVRFVRIPPILDDAQWGASGWGSGLLIGTVSFIFTGCRREMIIPLQFLVPGSGDGVGLLYPKTRRRFLGRLILCMNWFFQAAWKMTFVFHAHSLHSILAFLLCSLYSTGVNLNFYYNISNK